MSASQLTDRIDEEAQAWVLRLMERPDPETERACRAWRMADPRHEEAFQLAGRAWDLAAATSVAVDQGWRAEAEALRAAAARPRRPTAWAAGIGMALAASLVAALLLPPMLAPADAHIATGTAEVRAVRLADGSRLTVGARTEIEVDYSQDSRRVRLDGGQAFFEVAHDARRPFTVVAGDVEILVTGTKFDVKRIGEEVRVSVLEGRVELRRRPALPLGLLRPEKPARVLSGGLQAALDPGSGFALPAPAKAPPGEWREGRFYYADAPLSEVLADASRYSPQPIRAADEWIAALRVTISFEADNVGRLLGNLEEILPVKARQEKGGAVTIAADSSPT